MSESEPLPYESENDVEQEEEEQQQEQEETKTEEEEETKTEAVIEKKQSKPKKTKSEVAGKKKGYTAKRHQRKRGAITLMWQDYERYLRENYKNPLADHLRNKVGCVQINAKTRRLMKVAYDSLLIQAVRNAAIVMDYRRGKIMKPEDFTQGLRSQAETSRPNLYYCEPTRKSKRAQR